MVRVGAFLCVACAGLALFTATAFDHTRADDPLGVVVSPHTLRLSSEQGGEVVVRTSIRYSDVDCTTLRLGGVASRRAGSDSRGNLIAVFSEAAVEAAVAPPSTTLVLTGELKSGEGFSGSDTVLVAR
ncbi:MAG TPA: hypothetical protein PLO37_21465 [Candidatus Hydrogenedentes bacterium]|nr:hypothetical protein [Candidatus Hydrogenedentota bacterium]HPG69422.1 hypothetical protein [Candidatus Hydrogenedentota bacterium]